MSAYYDVLDLPINCKIRFETPEGTYEGRVKRVYPSGNLEIDSTYLPDGDHFGVLRFHYKEIVSFEVLELPKTKPEPVKSFHLRGETSTIDAFVDSDDELEKQLIDYDDEDLTIKDYVFNLPPNFSHLPSNFMILDCFDTNFENVISHLKTELTVGISLEGEELGRNGSISWLSISTGQCTFLFDVCKLETGLFDQGIRDIMEDVNTIKVIHDCRLVSDTLFHKYQTNLVNVFDTQVADKYVETQRKGPGPVCLHVTELNSCLRTYLNIPEEFLYRSTSRRPKRHLYYQRPPSHEFLNVMIKNVIYLLSLKEKLEIYQFEQFHKAVGITSRSLTAMSLEELELGHSRSERLPLDLTLRGFKTIKSTHCPEKNSFEGKTKTIFKSLQKYNDSSWTESHVPSNTIPSEGIQKTQSNFSGSSKVEKKGLITGDKNSDSVPKLSLNESSTPNTLPNPYSTLTRGLHKSKANEISALENCGEYECSQLKTSTSVDPWEKLKSDFSSSAFPVETDLEVRRRLVPSGQSFY